MQTLYWSPTLSLFAHSLDRHLQQRGLEIEQEALALKAAGETFTLEQTGPRPAARDRAEQQAELVHIWSRCARQMHALAREQGARYFHFLQPNQYVAGSKPLGPAEQAVAIDPKQPYQRCVVEGYPLLQQEGEVLRAAGIAFHDLTQIFAQVEEPLYVDACCHVNARGNEILARKVGEIILDSEP